MQSVGGRPAASKTAPSGTQSVLRAIALLKALTTGQRGMTLSELSRAVGLTKTTAHRLLAALQSEGLVARDPHSYAYRLGPAAIALGSQAFRSHDLRRLVRPHLEALAQRTGETATLEVLVDGQMLILDEVLGSRLLGTVPSVGTSWPLHATSTGKAYLASCPDDSWRSLVRPPLRRYAPGTITRVDRLAAELDRIRARGYATAVEELEVGFAAAGAAIVGPSGEAVGSISVGGPSSRLPEPRLRRVGRQVREAAARISEALGHAR